VAAARRGARTLASAGAPTLRSTCAGLAAARAQSRRRDAQFRY
jgi:hypothetical protein